MMTSSNGNIFRVTGPLCGEFTGPGGQWRGALMFSLVCARINDWVNTREAGDLRRHRCHCDVSVMTHLSFDDCENVCTSSSPRVGSYYLFSYHRQKWRTLRTLMVNNPGFCEFASWKATFEVRPIYRLFLLASRFRRYFATITSTILMQTIDFNSTPEGWAV